nr:anther-specific proline-rich protein APG-like [Salvelinus alpinus]
MQMMNDMLGDSIGTKTTSSPTLVTSMQKPLLLPHGILITACIPKLTPVPFLTSTTPRPFPPSTPLSDPSPHPCPLLPPTLQPNPCPAPVPSHPPSLLLHLPGLLHYQLPSPAAEAREGEHIPALGLPEETGGAGASWQGGGPGEVALEGGAHG